MTEICRVCNLGGHRHGACTENKSSTEKPYFSTDVDRITEELSGGGDVGNFLSRDLGLLMAAEGPLSLKQILDYKAGSLRDLTPEKASIQKLIHEKALGRLVAVGVLTQSGDRYALAESGAGEAWLNQKRNSGDMKMLIETGHDFLTEQSNVEGSAS